MVILHIIIDLRIGGAELMLKRLIEAHADNPNYRHRVISLRGMGTVGPQLQASGIEVEALGLNSPLGLLGTFARLVRRICAIKPEIVQTWMYHADLIGGLAARLAGRPQIIWSVRIADISPEMGVSRATMWIRRACAALSRAIPKRIVYVSRSAQTVHEKLGYDPRKSIFIPNGYCLVPLPFATPVGTGLRRELALVNDAVLIGSAGRFSAQKDPQTFVAAAALIASRSPNARFVMMGRGVDTSSLLLSEWVSRSGCGERIHLLGERDDMARCLAALDIFCLHSIGEGFPNVVAEAMSVGVPCVVTDVGDAASLVGQTGLVVPPGRPDLMAAALESLIVAGPEHRRRLGAQARERIANHFSMDSIRTCYENLYEALRC